jgi:hypothetical protein
MPYKVFVAGEEGLAADANAYLMSQTVPRFTNAAQRTAQLTAPVLNQLSALDTAKGAPDYWNGSAWVPMGVTYERTVFQSYGGSFGGTGQELSQATFTMPFAGIIVMAGYARVSPLAGQTAPVMNTLFDVGPSTVPGGGVGGQYLSPGFPATNMLCIVPFGWTFRGVAAGTACNLKVKAGSNVGLATLDWIYCTIRLLPAEF